MVGVAGRSKGCHTCRRRKVKCDETRPACRRCSTRNTECEGYNRYPVFINRSANGMHKREWLEEVLPATTSATAIVPLSASQIPTQMSQDSMYLEVYVGHFIDSLLPSCPSSQLPWSSSLWCRQAFAHTQPSRVMQQMIQALVATRFGRYSASDDLFHVGRRMYGQALKQLQHVIISPTQSQSDETLAAVRLMIVFESYEATSHNADAWHTHLDGIASVIQHRGPQAHQSPLTRSLLADLKVSMMIQAIMRRRASFLANPEWQLDQEYDKASFLNRVTLCGFQLAAQLEKVEAVGSSMSSKVSQSSRLNSLIASLISLNETIDDLHTEIVRKQGMNVACEVCGTIPEPCSNLSTSLEQERNQDHNQHDDQDVSAPCRFFFMLSILYALQIPLTATLDALHKQQRQYFPNLTKEQTTHLNHQINTGSLQQLGSLILDYGEHCVHPELGAMYERAMVFPLQGARWALIGSGELSARCATMIEAIYEKRSMPFAKQVNIGEEHVPSLARKMSC